jgi:hypothetical protein
MTTSELEFMMNGEKGKIHPEDDRIEKHMKERGKLIIKVIFHKNY